MHDKCPLPQGEGTLGIDRAIKTHNSMLVLRGPSRLVVRDPRGETSASRENAQHNKYRKANRNQAKSTLRRKKRKNLVAYIRWNTYMSYIRHFPVGINLLLWLCITVTHTLI